MSPPGRPKGEFRSAQHVGTPVSLLHIARLADAVPQPWRNGGGVTRDLLAWPPGGPTALRVSVATIDRDGPFSVFDGWHRAFNVLTGDGVVLRFPSGEVALRPGDAPLHFDGAKAPCCKLLGGTTQDLNLMALHSAGTVHMAPAPAGSALPGGPCWRGVYTTATLQLRIGNHTQTLPADSLAWSDQPAPGEPWQRTDTTHAAAWWLSLDPR